MTEWSTATVNDLPDSSFLLIKAGGKKDSSGKTTPRDLRMFPVKDGSGAIDMPHLRNAIARIPQADITPVAKKQLQAKVRQMLVAQSGDKAVSLGDLSRNIRDAVDAQSPSGQARAMTMEERPEYWWVKDIYPGYCIVEIRDSCYKVPYTADMETGAVSLASRDQWKQVVQEWVEVTA